jgi:hypothetical protein
MAVGVFPLPGTYYIVVFLLVFGFVFAILQRARLFNSSDIVAIIAASIAFIALFSSFFVDFVVVFVPEILGVLLLIFLALLVFSSLTISKESMTGYLSNSAVIPALIIFVIVIFGLIAFGTVSSSFPMGGLSSPFSSTNGTVSSTSTIIGNTTARTSFSDITPQYVTAIITNPTVFSLLLALVAMMVAVHFMTREVPPRK